MSTAKLHEPLPEGVFHLLTADDDVASAYRGYVAAKDPSVASVPQYCFRDDFDDLRLKNPRKVVPSLLVNDAEA